MDPVISSPSLSLSKESHFWYFWQAVAPRMKHLMCLCLCVCVYVNGFILHLYWWKKSCTSWDIYIFIWERYVKWDILHVGWCNRWISRPYFIVSGRVDWGFPFVNFRKSLRSLRLKLCSGSPKFLEVSNPVMSFNSQPMSKHVYDVNVQ